MIDRWVAGVMQEVFFFLNCSGWGGGRMEREEFLYLFYERVPGDTYLG